MCHGGTALKSITFHTAAVKDDFERRLCFFHNKKADIGFLPPLPTLDPEEKCQTYKNNRIFFE